MLLLTLLFSDFKFLDTSDLFGPLEGEAAFRRWWPLAKLTAPLHQGLVILCPYRFSHLEGGIQQSRGPSVLRLHVDDSK